MERSKYISLVTELRQIAVARALVLLNDKEDAEDVAAEVMLRLWERHRLLRDDADEVRHFESFFGLITTSTTVSHLAIIPQEG